MTRRIATWLAIKPAPPVMRMRLGTYSPPFSRAAISSAREGQVSPLLQICPQAGPVCFVLAERQGAARHLSTVCCKSSRSRASVCAYAVKLWFARRTLPGALPFANKQVTHQGCICNLHCWTQFWVQRLIQLVLSQEMQESLTGYPLLLPAARIVDSELLSTAQIPTENQQHKATRAKLPSAIPAQHSPG